MSLPEPPKNLTIQKPTVGDPAPEFELRAVTGTQRHLLNLKDYRGNKNVVLAFYVANWTPVWSAQLRATNVRIAEFAEVDAQVVGISVDSVNGHVAFQEQETGKLSFPLCSDFYPHGEVAERYGVLRLGPPIPGITERAIFIINKEGTIVFRKIYHLGEQPDLDEVLSVLRKLRQQELEIGSARSGTR